jgi:hypothetical protein
MIGGVPLSSSSSRYQHSIEGREGENFPGGRDNNANIHTQDHEMSSVPTLKLRWMPPSLTTRTNAGSLREVVDEQQMHWIRGDVVKEEDGEDDDNDFVAGGHGISHVRRTSRGGHDMDMDQDDMVKDDKVEFGSRLRIPPLCPPGIPSSSSSHQSASVAAGSSTGFRYLTVSRPAPYSPSFSESPPPTAQGTDCRRTSSSSSSSRIIVASSTSPSSSSSFDPKSDSSLSPPSMSSSDQN